MTFTNFWIVSGISLTVIIICMVINNAQYQRLGDLIYLLRETVKKTLILNGEPNKARKISLTEIPMLETWYDECRNYGWINVFGLISILTLIVTGGLYHSLSYIIVILSGLFLGTNIFFIPLALIRLNKAIKINNSYVLLLAAFDKAQEIHDTGNTSSN